MDNIKATSTVKTSLQKQWFPVERHNYICYPVTSIIINGQTSLTPGPGAVVQKHSHKLSGNIAYMLAFYHDKDCIFRVLEE